jgi:ketosteroid isomerase-like protein
MKPLGNDAALITYKTTVDGTCGGQKAPANRWAASVYVRDGDKWKGAFHAEAPVVDPKAAPAKPVDKKEARKEDEPKPADRDAGTNAMIAVEKAVWEAWKAHDAKKLEDLTARDISFINIFGTYFATKADALKDWTGAGCDVKSVSVTDAAGTMLSPTVGILTFKGAANGTCYGQKVGPIWGTSVYVRDGDAWKWTFGINLPARREGA